MTTLYIAEFAATYRDHAVGGGAAFMPPITEQTVVIPSAAGPANSSAAFNVNTRIIRVHVDANAGNAGAGVNIKLGANPTAVTAVSERMAINSTEYFGVVPGHKLSVITSST